MGRNEILAIRLTEAEKRSVEDAARSAGAESVSAFVRATLHLRSGRGAERAAEDVTGKDRQREEADDR